MNFKLMVYAIKSDTILLFETTDECIREMKIDAFTLGDCLLRAKMWHGWKFIHGEFAIAL